MASVRVLVKLTPKAARNEVKGWAKGVNGEDVLKCSVTEAPDKGKANKALIELLAGYWGISKSAITIVRGETDRMKTVEIQGLKDLPQNPPR